MTRVRIALAISVLLNLFLAGALAGGAFWVHARAPMIMAGSLRIAGAELPSAQRQAFRAAMRRARRERSDEVEASRRARAEAAALLRQPVLDQTALSAALARARAADLAVRGTVEDRAAAFAATLSPADRARLADAMDRRNDRARR